MVVEKNEYLDGRGTWTCPIGRLRGGVWEAYGCSDQVLGTWRLLSKSAERLGDCELLFRKA